jgi:hypothetical protein
VLKRLGQLSGARVVQDKDAKWPSTGSNKVTHVVCKTEPVHRRARRTIKYLMGIAHVSNTHGLEGDQSTVWLMTSP